MEPMVSKETKENMKEGVPEADNLLSNKDKTKEEEEEEGGNGGILNNLISNLMGATTTTTAVDEKSGENTQKSECEDEDEKKKEGSGAGILEKIISHLPVSPKASQAQGTNLCRCGPNVKFRSGRESNPEDAVPTTEEASILIHSVID
ncbi:PREDICTED: uncharacterized protein LOC106299482 isoform X1 [Brassica oleracea var. oleracea]|uniref:uncharacterized protein LOC106299482 isoform X1 n=1 Tax=Brassica oleracea var. oleracea TaxID=109376 RepID=UPI0006A73801|nr:PREDICTED: uncharacterized protein LOC106299482 isoform X1 [Brassica oleracea var. oleracea]